MRGFPRLAAWQRFLAHYGQVFAAVWRNRGALAAKGFTPQEAEFLPASLALQETPVSPLPRMAMWVLVAFAVIALLWAIFGKIDVVATATGKIIPNDRSKTIQSLEVAQVKAIHVKDGQSVKAGQVLIELDTAITEANQTRTRQELHAAQLDGLRSEALLQALDQGQAPRISAAPQTSTQTPPQTATQRLSAGTLGLDANLLAEAQRQVSSQYQEFLSKRAQLTADITKRGAELQSTQAAIARLEQTIPLARQRAQDYKDLVDKNFISKHGWMEKEQARLEQEGELSIQRSRLKEIQASLEQARQQRETLFAETRRMTLDQLTEAQRKRDVLQQELAKAQANTEARVLTAPVDGTVQQLAVHTVGGVVTEAQPLMLIVPKDHPVEIEATLENKDIGFVRTNQPTTVKVETFPYTKYGTLKGMVTQVSEDALQDEKRGLVYQAKVRLAQTTMWVDGRTVKLSPGMAVTVEIKTGQRRVIEYFLSPLIQHTSESLRER